MTKQLEAIDYDALDPGIRHVVKLLRDAGFDTQDSGDGSKAETMECALPFPMVYIRTTPEALVEDANKLKGFLRLVGYDVKEQDADYEHTSIQATYCPVTGDAGLLITGWRLSTAPREVAGSKEDRLEALRRAETAFLDVLNALVPEGRRKASAIGFLYSCTRHAVAGIKYSEGDQ